MITIDNITTTIFGTEATSSTTHHVTSENSNLIIVGLSSVFKSVAPSTCSFNSINMDSVGAITSPNGKSKVELFLLQDGLCDESEYLSDWGTFSSPSPHVCDFGSFSGSDIVVTGSDVFAGIVTIYTFFGANRNPIQDIQTQTGTTGQNPSLNLSSTLDNFTICLYAEDGAAVSLTLNGALTSRGANLFAQPNSIGFCGGSSIAGQGSVSATWVANSTSWSHLGVSLRGVILKSEIAGTRMLADNDKYQWMQTKRRS